MNTLLKILHLEDNLMDSELIRRELKRGKIESNYLLVDNKHDFINALDEFMPDIILSDHTLPAFSSKEALQIALQHPVKIPFILITGTVSEEYAVEIMKNGAYDYILKDHLQRLPTAVINAVEKCHIEKENHRFFQELITNEALLKEAERLAHLGSWEFDVKTGKAKWSDEIFRIMGYEQGSITPGLQAMLKNVHPEDLAYVTAMTSDEAYKNNEFIKFNYRIIGPDKKIKYIHIEIRAEKNTAGELIKLIGFNHDITDSYIAQDALRKSEANLRTIFDNTDIGYILLNTDFNIVSFNNVATKIGIINEDFILAEGQNIMSFVPEKLKSSTQALYQDALHGKPYSTENSYTSKEGRLIWYQLHINPVYDQNNEALGLIISIAYITERKKAELEKEKLTEALKVSHNSLKKLVTRVQVAREEERLHIAREVHDELGQVLTAMKIEVSMLHKKVPPKSENAFLHQEFLSIIKLIDKSIASVKKIATDLRPAMLDELGLVESLKWQVAEFEKTTGVKGNLTISSGFINLKPDINISTTLYRIVQEALTNVARHAKATQVKIAIKTNEESLFLVVQDNGVGITEDQKNRKKSFGLTGIRERVILLNGNMEISGRPGNGTIVYIQIPYKYD